MLRDYKWRGHTWQIADEDLKLYPGAELVKPKKAPATKSKRAPANKKKREVKDK